jgi:hypothetical protein
LATGLAAGSDTEAARGVPRITGAARRALPTLGAYTSVRATSVLTYALLGSLLGRYAVGGGSGRTLLTPEDSGWYRLIAQNGYDRSLSAHYIGSVYGFFPLYPFLMRLGHDATGLSVDVVGLGVTWIAAEAAAWALFEIGRRLYGARVGLALACLWAVVPGAVTESIMYADTLAIALGAWALYALLERRWLTAGALALLAGATRPTAIVGCLVVVAAVALQARTSLRAWTAALLAPAGAAAFLGYVALRDRRADGYLAEQRAGWGNRFDFGVGTLKHLVDGLHFSGAYASADAVFATLTLVAVPILLAVQARSRQPWVLKAYCLGLVVMVYGDDHFYTTTPRELLPLFPLLIPLARVLARMRRPVVPIVLIALLAVASGWYAGYIEVMSGPVT